MKENELACTSTGLGLPGHSAPTAGLEVPLEMLAACHGRIERQCDTLERLASHVARHGPDRSAREAAAAVLRYFDSAARDHHADEEIDLFPALIESMAGSDPVCLRELTASLSAEHRELERRWLEVRRWLAPLAAGDAAGSCVPAIAPFVERYRSHVEREEAELLPLARRLLGDGELDRIGAAMRLRRGVVDPDPALAAYSPRIRTHGPQLMEPSRRSGIGHRA